MSNKETKKDFSDINYRFSYVLTIDDIIICKRDFNINNLDEESLYSLELKETIDDIVSLIDRDLKAKSRVYTWYNYDENYVTPEFSTPLPEKSQTVFKFTLLDKNKPIISKIWDGDVYPFSVRNSVDLTNKKYKNDNKYIEMDFAKQIAQKGAAGRPDLTSIIMRHITSTCVSYKSRQNKKKIIYKQYIPELKWETISISDLSTNKVDTINNRLPYSDIATDDNGFDKLVYEVYTTNYSVGDNNYNLSINKQ